MDFKNLPDIDYPGEPLRRYFEYLAGVLMQPESLELSDAEHDKLHEELAAAIARINALPVESVSSLRARAAAAVWLGRFGAGDDDLAAALKGMSAAIVPEFAARVEAYAISCREQRATILKTLSIPHGRPN